MARQSTITSLPADILEKLQELLRDPRCTQLKATAQINAILEAKGHEERVTKSAVNRYSQRFEEVGARLRQSREVAEVWVGRLGNQPQGEVGKLLNEMIRTLAFETTMQAAEGEDPVSPAMLKDLALAVQRLESAANMNQERDKKIRDEARKLAFEEAANNVEETAIAQGMDKDQVHFWRQEVMRGL